MLTTPLWMGPSRVLGRRQKTQRPQGSKSRKEMWLPEAGPTHQSRDTELTQPEEIPHTASPQLRLAREADAWIYRALLFADSSFTELTSGSPAPVLCGSLFQADLQNCLLHKRRAGFAVPRCAKRDRKGAGC